MYRAPLPAAAPARCLCRDLPGWPSDAARWESRRAAAGPGTARARAPLPQICRAVRRGGLDRPSRQRLARDLVLIPGPRGLAHPLAAGAGGIGRAKLGEFVTEIESQVGWTTQLSWSANSLEQRRFDALRLLRQVPAVTELALLDSAG